jgi:hypothetical protein
VAAGALTNDATTATLSPHSLKTHKPKQTRKNSKQKNPKQVMSLAPGDVPVLALAPHVAASIANRTGATGKRADWILPIYPFQPPNPCTLADLVGGRQCIRGFSVQGRIEKSRRNYTEVWEQIGGHRRHHTSKAVANFRLNILGESVEAFSVPGAPLVGLVLVCVERKFGGAVCVFANSTEQNTNKTKPQPNHNQN